MTEAELYRFFVTQAARVLHYEQFKSNYLSDLDNIHRLAEAHHAYAEKMMELAK